MTSPALCCLKDSTDTHVRGKSGEVMSLALQTISGRYLSSIRLNFFHTPFQNRLISMIHLYLITFHCTQSHVHAL